MLYYINWAVWNLLTFILPGIYHRLCHTIF